MSAYSRRQFLVNSTVMASSTALPVLAQQRSIQLACISDNSAVEKANGLGVQRGAMACFAALNQRGGINGVPVELIVADDKFNPEQSKVLAQGFAADKSVLGIVGTLGTRQSAAVFEVAQNLVVVGPSTGTSGLLRKNAPANVFWVRASYDEEVDKLIRNAVTLGMNRIGIVHPKDPLGNGVLAAFNKSMAAHQLVPAVVATTPATTSTEVDPAAKAIAQAAPQMVVMVLAGVMPLFVKALRAAGGQCALYGLSVSVSAANIAALGDQARGLGFAIVTPSPFALKHELVCRYQADMAASDFTDYSLSSLEGYVNARVAAEGLRRAGTGLSRASFAAALESIGALDLGGLRIGYGPGDRQGSSYVDIAVIGADGRILA